jgi:hypothetical protein
VLAWDTETCPIRVAVQAPPLVVLSWADKGAGSLVSRHDAYAWARKNFNQPMTLANGPFDFAVMGNEFPDLMPVIFEMLAADMVHDVLMRQKMLDIANGRYSGRSKPIFFTSQSGVKQKVLYNLSCCHDRLLGSPMEKDEWRLRYAEFRDTPIDQWPAGARKYALDDAIKTRLVHLAQDKLPDAEEILEDEFRQNRAYWAIYLMRCWGIRTDLEAVKKLDARLEKEWHEVKARLVETGLVRKAGSKDTKLAKEKMFKALGDNCYLTDTGEGILVMMVKGGADPLEARREVIKMKDYKYVATKAEACMDAGTDELKDYHAYTHLQKLRGTYVDKLWRGVKDPIHSYFEPILESGRTSSSGPNLQNPPREPGVRECFMPRPGCVYAICDYDLAELRSLAQVCISVVGYSKLGDALNAGFDPHLSMAAQIMGISYDEAKKRREDGDEEVEEMRTLGKCANFGFPGGLGAKTFCAFAKATYGVIITEEQARKLKADWLEMWPEMREYFQYISAMFPRYRKKDEETEEEKEQRILRTFIKQYRSNRCRGGVTYTSACNTYFQGLTADAAKEALFEVARRQYCDPESALYGTHTVNFVHDELIVECPEEIAHEVAMELRDIMVEVYNRWTPDVPMTAEPCVTRVWSKKAKPRWRDGGKKPANDDDRLIPYEIAAPPPSPVLSDDPVWNSL